MSTLKVNSIIPVAGVPTGGGGGIVQIKQTVKTDKVSFGTSSFSDLSGMSVSITPTSTSHKVFIMSHMTLCHNDQHHTVIFRLLRGSTAICVGDQVGSNRRRATGAFAQIGNGDHPFTVSFQFMDSPSTTSEVTYKIQVQTEGGDQASLNGRHNGDTDETEAKNARYASTITAMEVSA
tara:strand:- start:782 stop:1315 length:534 start_codon:yes stop_codon:yes gene_type:complete